jgi:hypothetical protein
LQQHLVDIVVVVVVVGHGHVGYRHLPCELHVLTLKHPIPCMVSQQQLPDDDVVVVVPEQLPKQHHLEVS